MSIFKNQFPLDLENYIISFDPFWRLSFKQVVSKLNGTTCCMNGCDELSIFEGLGLFYCGKCYTLRSNDEGVMYGMNCSYCNRDDYGCKTYFHQEEPGDNDTWERACRWCVDEIGADEDGGDVYEFNTMRCRKFLQERLEELRQDEDYDRRLTIQVSYYYGEYQDENEKWCINEYPFSFYDCNEEGISAQEFFNFDRSFGSSHRIK